MHPHSAVLHAHAERLKSRNFTALQVLAPIWNGLRRLRLRYSTEAFIWSAALLWLFIAAHSDAVQLCPLHALGLHHCPGCGIGHAIGLALHMEWQASFSRHPLGIPAALILLHRILQISLVFPAKGSSGTVTLST